MTSRSSTLITVRLPNEVARKLEATADKVGSTKGLLLRDLVVAAVSRSIPHNAGEGEV